MNKKIRSLDKLGNDLLPLKEAIKYLPYKSFAPLRKKVREGTLKGRIFKGLTPDGDRYFVRPSSIRSYWKKKLKNTDLIPYK